MLQNSSIIKPLQPQLLNIEKDSDSVIIQLNLVQSWFKSIQLKVSVLQNYSIMKQIQLSYKAALQKAIVSLFSSHLIVANWYFWILISLINPKLAS